MDVKEHLPTVGCNEKGLAMLSGRQALQFPNQNILEWTIS